MAVPAGSTSKKRRRALAPPTVLTVPNLGCHKQATVMPPASARIAGTNANAIAFARDEHQAIGSKRETMGVPSVETQTSEPSVTSTSTLRDDPRALRAEA